MILTFIRLLNESPNQQVSDIIKLHQEVLRIITIQIVVEENGLEMTICREVGPQDRQLTIPHIRLINKLSLYQFTSHFLRFLTRNKLLE